MSLIDQIQQITRSHAGRAVSEHEAQQLEELAEVEHALKGIGVTLEPKFDISLAARIGAVSDKN